MKKDNQHYVFRGYLKPWSKNDQIYCLRNGKVFRSNLKGIACERFFYRFQDLTPEEIRLVESTFVAPSNEPLRTAQRRFMSLYSLAPRLRKRVDSTANPGFIGALDELVANGEEEYHQRIEDDLLVFIRRMLAGDSAFYSDSAEAARFLYAICVQYTRTKRMRETTVLHIGEKYKGCDVRRMISVLSPLLAISIGYSLYADRQRYKLMLVDNNSDTPFITTDQPIINIQAPDSGDLPDKLEFFYPLSPKRAMLLLELSSKRADFPVTAISVNHYNMAMVKNSYEQVFSDSGEYLNSIKSPFPTLSL